MAGPRGRRSYVLIQQHRTGGWRLTCREAAIDILFHAHSGLRYLILLLGIVTLLVFLARRLRGGTWGRSGRLLLATLTGAFDLQVVLGLILLAGGRRPDGIAWHLAWMVAAAGSLHAASVVQRRRGARAGHGGPLVAVALALALVVLGVAAIGRSVV